MMGYLACILTLLLICDVAISQPLWVSTTGHDTEACGESPTTACQTLGHTISKIAKPRAQIYMLPGMYVRKSTEIFQRFEELNISGFNSSATAVRITCDGGDKKLVFKSIPKIFVSNLTIADCHSRETSGALAVSGSGLNLRNVIIANSTINGKVAPDLGNGGCLAATNQSSVVIKNSTFWNCTATGKGGGVYIDEGSKGDLEVCQSPSFVMANWCHCMHYLYRINTV